MLKFLLNKVQIIAFTHRHFSFDEIGLFHLEDSVRIERLQRIKSKLKVKELMYLSTCNRVEFILNTNKEVDEFFLESLVSIFIPSNQFSLISRIEIFTDKKAVHHLFSLASSIDSLVVGEREIITQVRKAYEECIQNNLCGDFIRVLVQNTISTAKKVYTESDIATRPVSIVSLAFLELKNTFLINPKYLIVGAGKTITSIIKFINKNNHHRYLILNRSKEKAAHLVATLNLDAQVFSLNELGNKPLEFDYIMSCTGSKEVVLSKETKKSILKQQKDYC